MVGPFSSLKEDMVIFTGEKGQCKGEKGDGTKHATHVELCDLCKVVISQNTRDTRGSSRGSPVLSRVRVWLN
jgi:hypothetical protein